MNVDDERRTDALLGLFGDLVGGADIDELVDEFESIDSNSEEQMLPRLSGHLDRSRATLSESARAEACGFLRHAVATFDQKGLEDVFDFFLFPFPAPTDLAKFFGWILAISEQDSDSARDENGGDNETTPPSRSQKAGR